MKSFLRTVATGLIAAFGLWAEAPQPAQLRFAGLASTDRVFVDDEVVGDGERLARFGNEILIAPGEYTITVVNADKREVCRKQLQIKENAIVVTGCKVDADSTRQLAMRRR